MAFRQVWKVSWWVTRLGARAVLWAGWLLLLTILAAQLYVMSSRQIVLPASIRQAIEARLAEHGLRVQLGMVHIDFSGDVRCEDVRVGPLSMQAPLVTASSVYTNIDLWSLLVGELSLSEVRISGLDLHLPSMQSLSGVDEVMVGGVDLELYRSGREIVLSHLAGYVRQVPVQVYGRFPTPRGQEGVQRASLKEQVYTLSRAWLGVARQIQSSDSWLGAFDTPRVDLKLMALGKAGAQAKVEFRAAGIDLGKLPGGATGYLVGVRADSTLPLSELGRVPLDIEGAVASLQLPKEITAQGLAFRLSGEPGGDYGFAPQLLELQLASLRWREIEIGPLASTVTQPEAGRFAVDVSLTLAGAPWRVQGTVEPKNGTAEVALDGFVEGATLAFAGRQIGRELGKLLVPAQPAPLYVKASFAPGWKLALAQGRLHSGHVLVGGVPLDETGAEFTYDGKRVFCDNLVLRLGDSLAHGSYEMDARTMDFRFLLTGGLRPMGIDKWFHSWWSDFWSTFTFNDSLPVADVDVQGRWGDLTATQVFVQADCADTGLKGVNFERVRTRLYLRPHWFDIRHFDVTRAGQGAQGWLSRKLSLDKNTWTTMEFDVDSTLSLKTVEQLFKQESAELLAPYEFTAPPRLKLTGRVDSAAAVGGKHEHIDIDLSSTGAMTYHGFPLADLKVKALLRDERIELPELAVVFARGGAKGKALVQGPADARRLSFDIALADANLGAAIEAVAQLQPKSGAAPAASESGKAARARQVLFEQGKLELTLAAEGMYTDFYSFNGTGRAVIHGSELGQLNLFGPLSEALRGSFINLGSFSLNRVEAPFALQGERLRFDELRITGPSALIQAKGYYRLRDGALDFTTKVYPFDENSSVVGNAVGFVLTPFSRALEVKLTGTLNSPSWIFAYGPSRLLNTLIGGEKNEASPGVPTTTPTTP